MIYDVCVHEIQCMMYDTGFIIWYDKFPPRLSERGGEIVYQYEYQLLESRCRCGSITLKKSTCYGLHTSWIL